MTRYFRRLASLGLAAVLLALSSPALAGVNVVFPAQNTVAGPRITLGDVANVVADSPADQPLADLVGAVDLGPSPGPGIDLVLRRRQIEQR
ncbi:MAG: hypothetical protein LBL95_07710, partial [Deltaproteobacteria bacterium]|nr:hypothetical protein [Deltaproteobacteria bacterium]